MNKKIKHIPSGFNLDAMARGGVPTTDTRIAVGDEVLLEQCWEDEAGYYHDEYATVSRILPDGQLKFRIGHWKTRKASDQRLQAFLNQQEFYSKDVEKVGPTL